MSRINAFLKMPLLYYEDMLENSIEEKISGDGNKGCTIKIERRISHAVKMKAS